jgi:GWxTD domain-containing protein
MSPRFRSAAALALAAGLLAGAACRFYNLERKLAPANADFLSKVRYIISGQERRAFLELPDPEKPKFIEDFWKRRNPDPSSGENAFKIEYFKRIDQANKLFPGEGVPGWMTDRGRILILFGPPTDRITQPFRDANNRCQEVWYYGDFPVVFIDASCTGTYRLASYDLSSLRDINLMYLQDLNQAQGDAQKAFTEETSVKTLDFDADLKVLVRAPDRIEAVLGVEMLYERIWFKAEGTTMATTLEAALDLQDAQQAPVWESKTRHEIRLQDTEINRVTGKKYRLELPILVEGADKVSRLGGGRAVLVIMLTNTTGKEILKKTMDFK